MKTYHFATPTLSYGVVHTIVTCNHPTEAEYLLDERALKENDTTIRRQCDLNNEILPTFTWELFTVKPVAGRGREALLQARELQSLSKENAIRALKEMKIQQGIILAEQQALDATFAARRAAFVMKIGGVNPKNLRPNIPLHDEYISIESTYNNATLGRADLNVLENQRALTQLALENPGQIITTTDV